MYGTSYCTSASDWCRSAYVRYFLLHFGVRLVLERLCMVPLTALRRPTGAGARMYGTSYCTSASDWCRSAFVWYLLLLFGVRLVPERVCTVLLTALRRLTGAGAPMYGTSYCTSASDWCRSAYVRYFLLHFGVRLVLRRLCMVFLTALRRLSGAGAPMYGTSYCTSAFDWCRSAYVWYFLLHFGICLVLGRLCMVLLTALRRPTGARAPMYGTSYCSSASDWCRSAYVRYFLLLFGVCLLLGRPCIVPLTALRRPTGARAPMYGTSYCSSTSDWYQSAHVWYLLLFFGV